MRKIEEWSEKKGEEKKFDNHQIKLENGDSIYIFTDGYVDQFGGDHGKKFMAKKLRETLMKINSLKMEEQGQFLNNALEDWMGDLDQVDDILGIGSRFDF